MSSRAINDVMRKTAKLVEAKEGEKVAIELDLAPEIPIAELDAEKIKQVILNLVLNAIDAMGGSGPPITIRTRYSADRERIEISVRDRGPGIPKETLDHLFIPFFTTKPNGTGLGLAVCQRIVTNHSGEIRVESQVGVGTEFTVRLPLKPRKAEGTTTGSFAMPRGRSILE